MLNDGILAGAEAQRPSGRLDRLPFTALPFTALLQDDDQQRDAALSRLLSDLARPDVRVVRMGNSMRSRLMLEHILIQVAGPDGAISQDDGARRIARTIAERQGRETAVVLLITQAETLHSKTLRLLQAMQPYFAEHGAPTLRVVFVGRQAFRALLDGRGMTPLREALELRPQAQAVRPAPEVGSDPSPLPAARSMSGPVALAGPALEPGTLPGPTDHPDLLPVPPRPDAAGTVAASVAAPRRRRTLVLGLAVFAAMALAAYMGLHAALYRDQAQTIPGALHPAEPMSPVAAPPAPPVPIPAVQDPQASGPASRPAPPARGLPPDPGRNRAPLLPARGVSASAELPSQPPYENGPLPPAAASPNPRIVIHVPTGSEGAEAMSAHLLAGLGSRAGTVEARRVAGTPDRPSIRYFHPGDEPVAQQVAARMAGVGLSWTLQDFSTFLPRPSRGTIEVWLPRP